MNKWNSRKFLICVAAALASIGTSIAGLATSNEKIAMFGVICTIISSAIYAFCEAWVDGKAVVKTIAIQRSNADAEVGCNGNCDECADFADEFEPEKEELPFD